jgi:hypothetical protein
VKFGGFVPRDETAVSFDFKDLSLFGIFGTCPEMAVSFDFKDLVLDQKG